MTPFRNEKNSNWEGAYRVPAMVRWPGHIPAGTVLNGIVSHNDWFVTLLAAAGDTDVADRLKQGADLDGTTYKVHLDGHNQLDYLTGAARREPAPVLLLRLRRRRPDRAALRQLEVRVPRAARHRHAQHLAGAVHRAAGAQDLQPAHRPLRAGRRHVEHLLRLDARPRLAGHPGADLRRADAHDPGEFPPRQEPASFSIDQLMEKLKAGIGSAERGRSAHADHPAGRPARAACSPWAPTRTTPRRRRSTGSGSGRSRSSR